jgi:hypothetical protein
MVREYGGRQVREESPSVILSLGDRRGNEPGGRGRM